MAEWNNINRKGHWESMGKENKLVEEIAFFWMWFLPHFVLKHSIYATWFSWILYWPSKSRGQLLRVSCIYPSVYSHPLYPKWESPRSSPKWSVIKWTQIHLKPCFKYIKLIILITANEKKSTKTSFRLLRLKRISFHLKNKDTFRPSCFLITYITDTVESIKTDDTVLLSSKPQGS